MNPLFETAQSAWEKSCYLNIDWKISKDALVIDMIHRMVAHRIGALAVTNDDGKVTGIVTERDYLNKVAFLGRKSADTTVAEIATHNASELVTVSRGNPIDLCMEKMLARDMRHLLVRDAKAYDSEIVGLISVKDIVACAHAKAKAKINRLEDVLVHSEIMKQSF